MVSHSASWTGIVSSTEKGFTLLEMLVCILMLSGITLLSLSYRSKVSFDHYRFLNEAMLKQSEAILSRRTVTYEQGISYNSMGHINLARTVYFDRKKITFNLSSGYAFVK